MGPPSPGSGPPSLEAVASGGRQRLRRVAASLLATGVGGMVGVALTISLAALVYAGELAPFLAEGIALALLGGALVGAVVALRGSLSGTVATVQDATAAILAVAAANLVAGAPAELEGAALFSTVTVANGATALIATLLLVAMGRFRLGRLVRFLPHPVVGGFLAGTGWLLLLGGVALMVGEPLGGGALAALGRGDALLRWVPGVVLAVALVVLTRRSRHPLAWPGALLGAVGLFYLVMAASGATPASWRALGLLLGPFPAAGPLRPFAALDLAAVHWPSVASYAPSALAVSLLAAIGVLLNTTALELEAERPVDLDRELRVAGLGNLLVAGVGGLVGYHMLSDSVLLRRIGRGTRVEALGVAGLTALAFGFGAALLAYIPTMLLGGLLAYLGFSFLLEWGVEAYRRLARVEYATVLLILAAIAAVGFLPGLAVGLAAAVVLFVLDYSRTEVVRHELTGRAYRSRVSRGAAETRALEARGEEIHVLELQGYVFFGTASGLLERIETRLARPPSLRAVVLDFRRVTGVDATALVTFEKLMRLADRRGFALALSDLSPRVGRQFEVRGLPRAGSAAPRGGVERFADLDAALEACEARLLAEADLERDTRAMGERLADALGDRAQGTALLTWLERVEFAPGEPLLRQGDPADTLWLVASGEVTARLERAGQPPIRLETMRSGSLVGELGFYTGNERSASVVADEPTVAYRLTRSAAERMRREDPVLAASLHELVVRLLAGRTTHLMRVVAALQR